MGNPFDYVSVHVEFEGGGRIPVEYNTPFSIKQTRGFDPYMFSLVLSEHNKQLLPDPASLKAGAKCSFIFSTPGAGGGRIDTQWGGIYLVRLEPSKAEAGLWVATFADERWEWQYHRYDVSMNLQWSDGSYRLDTTRGGGGGQWRVIPALQEACRIMGLTVDVSRIRRFTPPAILPNNLGNSPGGGWVQAMPAEILGPIIDCLDCDVILDPKKERHLILVERTGDAAGTVAKIRAMPRLVDTAGSTINGYEQPRELEVSFEIKAEAALESFLPATTTSIPAFDIPTNVMARFTPELIDPAAWLDAEVSQTVQKPEWADYRQELVDRGYASSLAEAAVLVARNWFLPNIIPITRAGEHQEIREATNPTDNSLAYQKKLWYDEMLRRYWRRMFKIEYPTDQIPSDVNGLPSSVVSHMRSMVGLRFGRMMPGGDTVARGSVFCDWSEETVHAIRLNATDPLKSEFSTNHPFDSTRPAPFTCRWVAESGSELLFELVPSAVSRISQSKILPGLFLSPLTYGDWGHLSGDGYLEHTELQGRLDDFWSFRIILSGRLIAPDGRNKVNGSTPIGEFVGRRLSVKVPLFPEGSLPSIAIMHNGATANYAYTKAQMEATLGFLADQWPAQMLNLKEIKALVDDAASKLKQQLQLGLSGGLSVAGVQPLAEGLYTGGDIHEMSVCVGDPDPWSIKTQYIILPGVPAFTLDKVDREGKATPIIEQE